MKLADALETVVAETDLQDCTVEQYRRAVKRFSEFLETEATEEHLSEETVNRWLLSMQKTHSGVTARNYRVSITRVWNYLSESKGIREYNIRRLRKSKELPQPVYAWSMEQLGQLLEACPLVPGWLDIGLLAADMLIAWVWIGYDTGLRPSDLRRLRWDSIDFATGQVTVCQHKTSVIHTGRLSADAIASARKIQMPERELVFPLSKGGMRRWELKLYAAAATVGFRRRVGQGLGTLRKSHATQVYTVEGDAAAAESLGHIGGVRTVRRSYIDARARRTGRLPPRIT